MVFKVINAYERSEYAVSKDKVTRLKSPGTPGVNRPGKRGGS
jgi:hypothetical protein